MASQWGCRHHQRVKYSDSTLAEIVALGLRQDLTPRIFVSDSDFIAMTKNGTLCNKRRHLGPREFENVLRDQLRLYTQARNGFV